jgi:tetratricopeptide (TPR) repeat protein
MLAKAITILESEKTTEAKKYFIKSLGFLKKAKIKNTKLKLKFQKSLPTVVKSYGLDYDSILAKIAYLEVSSKCLELNESPETGLKILTPIMKRSNKPDPRIFELYAYLLTLENKYSEAKEILLKANSLYPHTQFILTGLFDLINHHEQNKLEAEKYLLDLLKYYPYDISVLTKAHDFYQSQRDPAKTAKYAYLYGLRTHAKPAYQQALYLYLYINDLNKAKNIVSKLLTIDKNDPQSIYLINIYFNKLKDKNKKL